MTGKEGDVVQREMTDATGSKLLTGRSACKLPSLQAPQTLVTPALWLQKLYGPELIGAVL